MSSVLPFNGIFNSGIIVFRKLKEIFTIEPMLAALDLDMEMRVEADMSDYAIGGVCCQ